MEALIITEEVKLSWGHDETGNRNDTRIIVRGTTNAIDALLLARDKFKKDVTDLNGCIAHKWHVYSNEEENLCIVTMDDVG